MFLHLYLNEKKMGYRCSVTVPELSVSSSVSTSYSTPTLPPLPYLPFLASRPPPHILFPISQDLFPGELVADSGPANNSSDLNLAGSRAATGGEKFPSLSRGRCGCGPSGR